MELRREFKITLEMGAVENIGLEPNTLKGMLNKTLLEMLERSVGECAIGTIGIIVGEDMISISISNGTYITSYTNRELYEKILNIIREFLSGGKK
ncbi:hypothetical protein DRO60_01450 [Candidatus Bathyarchaeota archaeon]|nr:MAG: hypothetical protein DRO60_01450 [Candidatus Bathyarchaeota archaeon]